jgi:2-(1,2-epoxy-1,2-dihydrophenyl)acetyl-CoA isomerase
MTGGAASDTVVTMAELVPGAALATLNRPKSRNALAWESWEQLRAAADAAAGDPSVRCLVITGAGGFFSSGGDLKSPPVGGTGPLAKVGRLELAHSVIRRLQALQIPVIAAVEGGAVGLGWSLVLACDLVVAAEDAFFQAPFVDRGVVPDGGAVWMLSHRAGPHISAEWLLTGARVSATEAFRVGLVNRLVPSGTALEAAGELARSIGAASPDAVQLTKRLLAAADGPLDTYLALELTVAAMAQAGPDAAEGRQAFAERRPPRWNTGRSEEKLG